MKKEKGMLEKQINAFIDGLKILKGIYSIKNNETTFGLENAFYKGIPM